MNSARRPRRAGTIIAALVAFALTPALSACNTPIIPGWTCTGYRQVTARQGETLSGMIVRSTTYSPHTAASLRDIQVKITAKYGNGQVQAGKTYPIPRSCHT